MTYAKAGVDARHIHETHKLLARRLESTFATRKGKVGWPIFPIGHYAGLVDLGQGRCLASTLIVTGRRSLLPRWWKSMTPLGFIVSRLAQTVGSSQAREPIGFSNTMA